MAARLKARAWVPIAAAAVVVIALVTAAVLWVVVPQQEARADFDAARIELAQALGERTAAAESLAAAGRDAADEHATASELLAVAVRGLLADPASLDRLAESRDALVAAAGLEVSDDGAASSPGTIALDPVPLPEAPGGVDELRDAAAEARALIGDLESDSAGIAETARATAEATDATAAAALDVIAAAHAWSLATPAPPHTPSDAADAYAAASAALAEPAEDADPVALLTDFATTWFSALAAHEVASRALPADQVQPTVINGTLIVNKTYRIPSTYGDGLTAETQAAFAAMQAEAAALGLDLYISSGFRSFGSQQSIYGNYVASQGQAEADRHSARPGHSEHQSGLTFDLNTITESFGATAEGIWVRDNAHRFGFVVRYPPGKEHITGYIWEPWHLRYLGVPLATELVTTGLTLEEYLGITSAYSY